jgi:hypothetical protein
LFSTYFYNESYWKSHRGISVYTSQQKKKHGGGKWKENINTHSVSAPEEEELGFLQGIKKPQQLFPKHELLLQDLTSESTFQISLIHSLCCKQAYFFKVSQSQRTSYCQDIVRIPPLIPVLHFLVSFPTYSKPTTLHSQGHNMALTK